MTREEGQALRKQLEVLASRLNEAIENAEGREELALFLGDTLAVSVLCKLMEIVKSPAQGRGGKNGYGTYYTCHADPG